MQCGNKDAIPTLKSLLASKGMWLGGNLMWLGGIYVTEILERGLWL